MSYSIEDDGVVKFRCNGCSRTTSMRTRKTLPKGWLVTGVLLEAVAPEEVTDDTVLQQQTALDRAAEMIGAHFHSKRCADKALKMPEVQERIRKAGVALALYSKCEVVFDGTGGVAPGRAKLADVPDDYRDEFKLPGEAPAV